MSGNFAFQNFCPLIKYFILFLFKNLHSIWSISLFLYATGLFFFFASNVSKCLLYIYYISSAYFSEYFPQIHSHTFHPVVCSLSWIFSSCFLSLYSLILCKLLPMLSATLWHGLIIWSYVFYTLSSSSPQCITFFSPLLHRKISIVTNNVYYLHYA